MLWALTALILAYAVALLAWASLKPATANAPGPAVFWSIAVLACTSIVMCTGDHITRALTVIFCVIVALRVYSYAISGASASLGPYLQFLSIGLFSPHLLYAPRTPSLSRASSWRELSRMAIAAAAIAATFIIARQLIVHGPGRQSWTANHLIVVAAFAVIMTAFGQLNFGVWNIRGLRSTPLVDQIWLARTPADFWRRWSWPIHLWLYRCIYQPLGGKHRAPETVLAVFAFSAVLHELIAFVALGRATGHQSAFFALSAIGVLASPGLERLGATGPIGTAVMRTTTLAFLTLSAAMMFRTIDLILPLYATHPWFIW